MREFPTITIMTGTLNSNLELFEKVLKSIKKQTYPKNLIDHVVFDKGSTNGCVELAIKYDCKVIIRNDPPEKQQVSAALGILKARGELVLIIESDNILIGKDWLMKMIKPFVDNKDVFCSFSLYNGYEKNMSATTKYCAFFGVPEPTLYYLNKSEKNSLIQKKYTKGKLIREEKDYFLVKFNKKNLPTLGDNGHLFKKSAIRKIIKKPESYIHVDIFMEALEHGFDTFGVVKNSIIHVQNPSILGLVKRKIEIKKIYYDGFRGKRKYLVYNPKSNKDKINLIKFIIFSLTFIIPLLTSIRGYLKIRDKAWFLHPVLCFLMVTSYGLSEVNRIRLKFLNA